MFETIRKLLGGKKPPTAEAIRVALTEIDVPALEAALATFEKRRVDAILSGDATGVATAEQAADAARRDVERARIAIADLERRLAETEAREQAEALEIERQRVEQEAQAVAEELRTRWPEHQRAMIKMLERMDRADDAVAALNERLARAGRSDLVQGVEWRVRPYPTFAWEGATTIKVNVTLPELPEWGLTGWGGLPQPAAFWSTPAHAPTGDPPRSVVLGAPAVARPTY